MDRCFAPALLCSMVATLALGSALLRPTPEAVYSSGPELPPPPCVVTQPNGVNPADLGNPDDEGGYGTAALWTNLWMWGEERVPVPPSHVQLDGSLGEMKWAWYRFVPGRLTIEGSRLDAPAPPLRAWIPDGYGDRGFLPTGLTFPTEGCWQVTGRLGDQSLTFVTSVFRVDSSGNPIPATKTASP